LYTRAFSLILFYLFAFIPSAWAQLSPGELSQAHADLEGLKNCTKCHDSDKGMSPVKCLDCHKALQHRISNKQGLHAGRGYQKCEECHVEHQGRSASLVWWKPDREQFDHALTGYILAGGHKKVKCENCHRSAHIQNSDELSKQAVNPAKTYLGLSATCSTCHSDEHRGALIKPCQECHGMEHWKPADNFLHASSQFALTGKHAAVACQKCHPLIKDMRSADDPDYMKLKGVAFGACTDCHKDYHEGKFNQACQSCHSTTGWQQTPTQTFDHDKTGYSLQGKHRKVACTKCHLPGKSHKGLKHGACSDCHRDEHQGQLTKSPSNGRCEACHTVNGFQPASYTIEQHQISRFPLRGAHIAVPCIECHQKNFGHGAELTPRFDLAFGRCQECHRDVHNSTSQRYMDKGECTSCHTDESWHVLRFDHSKTPFPLQGKHGRLPCSDCHKYSTIDSTPAVLFSNQVRLCCECHPDVHRGQFNEPAAKSGQNVKCDRCHTSFSWKPSSFQHDRDSRFKLEGKHKALSCESCHKPLPAPDGEMVVRYKPLGVTCEDCHAGKAPSRP
jgi:hypothetical protein